VPEPLLAVRDLEIRYGAVRAVRAVSFEVGRGEVVGLVGPNGAGKSSTLLAIMGMVEPASGGSRTPSPRPARFVRRGGPRGPADGA